jgi:site-specific recombinase XerD
MSGLPRDGRVALVGAPTLVYDKSNYQSPDGRLGEPIRSRPSPVADLSMMTVPVLLQSRGDLAGAATPGGELSPDPARANPVEVYLAQLAPNSRRAVRSDLARVAAFLSPDAGEPLDLPWHRLRYEHVAAIRQRLATAYAPSSANRLLSSLRGVLRESWNLGLMPAEAYQRAIHVKPVRGSRLPAGRALTAGEIRTLFRACAEDRRPAGIRDAALLAVLYGAGVRRAEAVQLDLADFDTDSGAVRVRSGKGNRQRITYVQGLGALAVTVWIDLRGLEAGPLFLPIHRSGRIGLRRMREQSIYDILRRRAGAAGVPPFSPHDLRRTFAGDLLDAGADISTVQQLLGHASVTTTQRYDRRGEATKRRAAALLHVPYVR